MRHQTNLNIEKAAFSIDDAARALSIGRTSLYQQVKVGRLRTIKCGRRTLVLARDIDAFLNRLQQEGGAR